MDDRRQAARQRPALGRLLAAGVGALSAAGVLPAAGCNRAPKPERPDLIVISLDSVRADDLTFTDEERAPNLTALARRGVVFAQALSGTSWTLPAHVQLFTGQPPSLHRVESDDLAIDGRTPTLPELARAAGYATAGVFSGWYLSGEYGFARGFQSYASAMGAAALAAGSERTLASHAEVTSPRVTELALQAADRVPADQPLLLFAHYFDPHYDYIPPGEWATRFDPDYDGPIDGHGYWNDPRIFDETTGRRVIGERDLEHVRALYRGEIAWTDHWVGELLKALEARGRLDHAVIVVLSDHGDEFFEHGNRGHRQSLYDEVLRVPLLIVPPGAAERPAPRVTELQVSLSDVLPTVLDLAGLEPPPSLYGRSLRPLLEGRAEPAERPLLASLMSFAPDPSGAPRLSMIEALRSPPWKLLRRTRAVAGSPPEVDLVVLFDLESDPAERRPVFAGPPARVPDGPARQAWEALEVELARQRAHYARLPHASLAERHTEAARSFEGELAGLGYVSPALRDLSPAEVVPWGVGPRPPAPLPR